VIFDVFFGYPLEIVLLWGVRLYRSSFSSLIYEPWNLQQFGDVHPTDVAIIAIGERTNPITQQLPVIGSDHRSSRQGVEQFVDFREHDIEILLV
jgi:hypothetical protein